jgi:hypothetical protein
MGILSDMSMIVKHIVNLQVGPGIGANVSEIALEK